MCDSKHTIILNNVTPSKSNCECADILIIFDTNQECAAIDVVFRNVFCVNTKYLALLEATIITCTTVGSSNATS